MLVIISMLMSHISLHFFVLSFVLARAYACVASCILYFCICTFFTEEVSVTKSDFHESPLSYTI